MEDIIKVAAVCMKSNYVPPISDSGYSTNELDSSSLESRKRRESHDVDHVDVDHLDVDHLDVDHLDVDHLDVDHLDWLEDKNQWEILNQFVWYQAQTVLMEIYRRDGNYKTRRNGQPRKTCQEIGDKIVSIFWPQNACGSVI